MSDETAVSAVDVGDLRHRLAEASALVAAEAETVAKGGMPRLEPLAPLIEELTRDMARLPPGRGRSLRPALISLLDEIARLGDRLLAERARTGERLREAGAYRRAGEAYRRAGDT